MLRLLAIVFLTVWANSSQAQETIQHSPGFSLNSGFDSSGIENPADFDEPDWSAWIATQLQLNPLQACEVRTRTGKRIDILTDWEAIEVEWVPKWYESIGQAVFYSIETNRPAAVILLSRNSPKEREEISNCKAVCARVGIRLYVQIIPAIIPPAKEPPHVRVE